jgi:nitronate monooxygenase
VVNNGWSDFVDATNKLLEMTGIQYPIICGAMYPCSNPELIAAVSGAGGIGIIQPISMSFVHGYELRVGIKKIKAMTKNPLGFNAIVEKTSTIYEQRMRQWIDIALDEGVRFFITALGDPRWVVEKVHAQGGIVFHDVTSRKHAMKALECGIDGLICVNNRAGGHAGELDAQQLHDDLSDLGVPLICAGGVGGASALDQIKSMGYAGVQLGTRFIATEECLAHQDYKNAIVRAAENDIVLTDKISGVPVAVINTPYIQAVGTRAGALSRYLLKGRKTKHWMRMFYTLRAVWQLRKSLKKGSSYKDYWQAGKSVSEITKVCSARDIVVELGQKWLNLNKEID